MHEFVESMYDIEDGREKVKEICDALGMEDSSVFGAKYIEHYVVNNETLDYRVVPATTADYAVMHEIDSRSTGGEGATIGRGPINRLRRNGFVVADVSTYIDGAELYGIDEEVTSDVVLAHINYVGEDHPIIEYWDE